MEQDILEQLYFGRIVPWENRNDKTPEMEQCSEQVYRDTEHLTQLLDEDGKKILERLMDNRSELESHQILEGFKDGFRLGVQLTAAHTNSARNHCVIYSAELTCYYPLLERICVHRKGEYKAERQKNGGFQNE